jgi:alpha-tubulin suppressor-like RCC1 family protein
VFLLKAGLVLDLQKVTQVTCGWRHTVAVTDRGNVYSWGRGTSGQLGHGDAVDRCFPLLFHKTSSFIYYITLFLFAFLHILSLTTLKLYQHIL